jgi:subtilisin family serine protease
VTVAVLDTGIDATHPEIRGKVVGQYTIDKDLWDARRTRQPRDTHGQGTLVAGLICGTHVGVAPDARLLSVVMIPTNQGRLADFILALEFAAARPEVQILTICAHIPSYIPSLQDYVNDLTLVGVLPIVAVGNEGLGRTGALENCLGVVSVGSASRQSKVSNFSGSGSRVTGKPRRRYTVPSLVAPGEGVLSCAMGGGYTKWSGTAPATAIVAGVAALILEKYPTISSDGLREELLATCKDLGEPAERQGNGLIQVKAAL